MQVEGDIRDLVDAVMVQLEILESDISRISKESKHKGIVLSMFYTVEKIRDAMVKIKKEIDS